MSPTLRTSLPLEHRQEHVCADCGHPPPLAMVYRCFVCDECLCALCYVVVRENGNVCASCASCADPVPRTAHGA